MSCFVSGIWFVVCFCLAVSSWFPFIFSDPSQMPCMLFLREIFFNRQCVNVWNLVERSHMKILGVLCHLLKQRSSSLFFFYHHTLTLFSVAFPQCFITMPMTPANKTTVTLTKWLTRLVKFSPSSATFAQKISARKSFETFFCRLLSYASKAARSRNSEICWQKASHGGCVNRTDVLTIHLTMTYLHWLFKYRTDLKLYPGPCAVIRWRVQCWNAVSWGYAERNRRPVYTVQPFRSSRQVKTSGETESRREWAASNDG